jgi:hypothetical protein
MCDTFRNTNTDLRVNPKVALQSIAVNSHAALPKI